MNKNIVIIYLGIIISLLVGFIIITNTDWFSDEWWLGLGIIIVGITTGAVLTYFKISR